MNLHVLKELYPQSMPVLVYSKPSISSTTPALQILLFLSIFVNAFSKSCVGQSALFLGCLCNNPHTHPAQYRS